MDVYSECLDMGGDFVRTLLDDFCVENVHVFLQNLWLNFNEEISYSGPLSYMVYVNGKNDEVYTKEERIFIDAIEKIIVFGDFYRRIRTKSITCRVVAVDLIASGEPIYDSLKFMKIFNKAQGDFNVYVFVSQSAIYLGCNKLGNSDDNCFLSYPLTESLDWGSFQDMMMYIDHDSFIDMYYDMLSAFGMTGQFSIQNDDNDDNEYLTGRINYNKISQKYYDEDDRFQDDLKGVKERLAFIHSNVVNPVELLFQAEEAETKAETNGAVEGVERDPENTLTDEEREKLESLKKLLGNPDALLKAMKARTGL